MAVKQDDIVVGARLQIESGTVFIIDAVEPDPSSNRVIVKSSIEGGKKGNYRDYIEDVVEFLNEERAKRI